ncbi:unnamed protein product [Linum tenue]|uniref:Uncharacterized protein n=1 Tax=Linum tenue TaxID=586396 RepID=A0AAV0Q2V8_9ROSI|nr:unnamed protein product [Linum tenue]
MRRTRAPRTIFYNIQLRYSICGHMSRLFVSSPSSIRTLEWNSRSTIGTEECRERSRRRGKSGRFYSGFHFEVEQRHRLLPRESGRETGRIQSQAA